MKRPSVIQLLGFGRTGKRSRQQLLVGAVFYVAIGVVAAALLLPIFSK